MLELDAIEVHEDLYTAATQTVGFSQRLQRACADSHFLAFRERRAARWAARLTRGAGRQYFAPSGGWVYKG